MLASIAFDRTGHHLMKKDLEIEGSWLSDNESSKLLGIKKNFSI